MGQILAMATTRTICTWSAWWTMCTRRASEGETGWQIYYPVTQATPNGAELVVRTTLPPAIAGDQRDDGRCGS